MKVGFFNRVFKYFLFAYEIKESSVDNFRNKFKKFDLAYKNQI